MNISENYFPLSKKYFFSHHLFTQLLLIIFGWLTFSDTLVYARSLNTITHQKYHLSSEDINPKDSCSFNIESLTPLLLKELPNYGNRVIQKTQEINQNLGIQTFIIAAGKAEFEPLNLPQFQYNPTTTESTSQIFFTTLERQYTNNRKIDRQIYHWLFLTPTTQGWRMITLFSRFGTANKNSIPTPPQETSNGIIAQAIRKLLQDCRQGNIKALKHSPKR